METVKGPITERKAESKPGKPELKPPSSEKASRVGSTKEKLEREEFTKVKSEREGSARKEAVRCGSARLGSAKDVLARDGSTKDVLARDGSAKVRYVRCGSEREGFAKEKSEREESTRKEAVRCGSTRVGSAKDVLARDGSARKEPARCGSARKDCTRNGHAKDIFQATGKQSRSSMIPVATPEKKQSKGIHPTGRKSYSSSKICCASLKLENFKEDLENKLKLLEEKKNIVELYYTKIEEIIRKLKKDYPKQFPKRKPQKPNRRISNDSSARKMISEPVVFSKDKIESSILSDLENDVQEISKIWLGASTDLSCTFKNFLKSNPSLDPMQVEVGKVKIHLAIKQTKSLMLVKTRDVIAEAKKLFLHRKVIRAKLENFISEENLIKEFGRCEGLRAESIKKMGRSTSLEIEEKVKVGGTGDSYSDRESPELSMSCSESTSSETERAESPGTEEEYFTKSESRPLREDSSPEEKDKNSETRKFTSSCSQLRTRSVSVENWARDLARKNETITSLNNRIFDLQKACNEHTVKYGQLQLVLNQFEDKIKWNRVLWKQISKLKEQIKFLSKRNKNLESQKTELESKLLNLDQQLEYSFKLNRFLSQKKLLLESRADRNDENFETKMEKCEKEMECSADIQEKILAEKQNAINQLKALLDVMKEQENFAQNQISVFQRKIEELEKHTKV